MTLEVHILGTSSARPTSSRAVSGSIVSTDEGVFVVDAGEGFQSRFQHQRSALKKMDPQSSIRPSRIVGVCFTHAHLDHTWGLLPWLQSMSLDKREQPLYIMAPTSEEVIQALLNGLSIPEEVPSVDFIHQIRFWMSMVDHEQKLPYEIHYILGNPLTDTWVQLNDHAHAELITTPLTQMLGLTSLELNAHATIHSVPSCAWSFTQQAHQGVFDRALADELGLSTRDRSMLSAGKNITHNGVELEATSFRGAGHPPIRLVISGDTSANAPHLSSLDFCNVLIHEATFTDEHQAQADAFLHSTSRGAASTAEQMNAEVLCLTHYSNRIKTTEASIVQASQQSPELRIIAANDHDRIRIRDNGDVVHFRWIENSWNE